MNIISVSVGGEQHIKINGCLLIEFTHHRREQLRQLAVFEVDYTREGHGRHVIILSIH